MQRAWEWSPVVRALVSSTAVVILLGGMKLAGGILSPIIFAVFVAILWLPLVRWLQRKGLPTWAALLLFVGVLAVGVALIVFIFLSLSQLHDNLPAYQTQVAALGAHIQGWLARFGIDAATIRLPQIEPATVISTITGVLSQTINSLILALLILVGIIFTRGESDRFGAKWHRLGAGGRGKFDGHQLHRR